MHTSSFNYVQPSFSWLALFAILVAVAQIALLGYAYEKMGISRMAAYAILLFSLIGSYVNIPLVQFSTAVPLGTREIRYHGATYVVPVIAEEATTLAINLGGAVIPMLLSLYLIAKHRIYLPALGGIAMVAAVVYWLAEPIPQLGIAVPSYIPPIAAAIAAILLSRDYAAPLAYVCGCVGTLVGADLMNLGVLSQLGASVASIGGAGTFDAVFLTGVLAVLLAGTLPTSRATARDRVWLESEALDQH